MASIAMLSALTVPKLKERCRELGIPVGGKKADLITRIRNKLSDTNEATTLSDHASLAKTTPKAPIEPTKPAARATGATKRKLSLESLSCTPHKKVTGNKKKTSKDTEIVDNAPPTLPSAAPVANSPKRNTQGSALPNPREDIARDGSNTTGKAKETSPTTTVFRASNSVTRFGGSSIPRNRTLSSYAHDKVTGKPEHTHYQPETNNTKPSHGKPHTTALEETEEVEEIGTTKRNGGLAATNQRKGGVILSAQGNINVHRSPLDTLGLTKVDGHKFIGLSIPSLSEVRYNEKGNTEAVMSVRMRKASIGLNKEKLHSNIEHLEKGTTVMPSARGFKALKLNIKTTNPNKHNVPNSSLTINTASAIRKHDNEISASIIRNPPRYSLRKQVERIARVLALVAFHSCLFENTVAPGHFLKRLALVSRNYRYASTLAFTNLVKLEFYGKRTQNWFKSKKIDEKVADVRSWYWHRVSERANVIKKFRTSWMERVWRFLVLASESIRPSTLGSSKPVKFGLWFNGINQHLMTDPDFIGQFETSIRFWIRRFYVCVTRNGGGYPLLLQDLHDEMIQGIHPLVETENRDLWRVETKCGDVHFIVGLTGEVIGRVEVDMSVGDSYLNPALRRARPRIGTTVRLKTGASRLYSKINESNHTNIDTVTWKSLREDWREHASTVISSSTASGELNISSQRLIELVYRPDSKTVSNGIHESIKLPHHRALAERWVLAQIEPGGISGKPVLDVFHGPVRRKEKLGLDLQAKLTVESVRCSGEKWMFSIEGVLAQGVGFVQTPGMGWFVLEETGQNIAQEEYGIQGLWATVLGVNENGTALSANDLEGLAEMFIMKDTLDYM